MNIHKNTRLLPRQREVIWTAYHKNKQAQSLMDLLSKAKQDYNTAKGNYDKAKAGYQSTIGKQQQMISHLEQQLTQKDSEILTLQTALIELTEQVEGWSMMLGNLQDNATWLNSQLKPLETRL